MSSSNAEYRMKSFSPLIALAMADMSEEARIARLAFMARQGHFGWLSRDSRNEMTMRKAKEILNHTEEPKGAKGRLAVALYEEHARQQELFKKRERARYEESLFDPATYTANRYLPLRKNWKSDQRRKAIELIGLVREAQRMKPKDMIARLAYLERKGKLSVSYRGQNLIQALLGNEVYEQVTKEEVGQEWLANRRERRKEQEELRNKPLFKRTNKQALQMKHILARANAREINLNAMLPEQDFDCVERWGKLDKSFREIESMRLQSDGTVLFVAYPRNIIVEHSYSGNRSWNSEHNVRFLFYLLPNGKHGRLRVNLKDTDGTVEDAIESLKPSTVKKKEQKHYYLRPDFETWEWVCLHPRRRKPTRTPFKLAQRGESPAPSTAHLPDSSLDYSIMAEEEDDDGEE